MSAGLIPKMIIRDMDFSKSFFSFCLTLFIALPVYAGSHNEAGKKYTVAFAQDTLANDWRVAQVNALSDALSLNPDIHFVYTDGGGSSAKQILDIENFTYQKVDVLVTSPRDGLASTPVVSNAYKQGIPVVLITRGIQGEDYTTLIAPDDYEIARDAAQFVASKLDGKGRILILRGVPTASTAKARTAGFLDEIKKYPEMSVVAIKDGNYLRADAIKAVEEALAEGLEFDVVYSQSDSMVTGVRLALKKAGIDPKSKIIVGIDYISEAKEAILLGEQSATFIYPTCGKEAAEAIQKILMGEEVPKRIKVDSTLITIDNVNKVKPIF